MPSVVHARGTNIRDGFALMLWLHFIFYANSISNGPYKQFPCVDCLGGLDQLGVHCNKTSHAGVEVPDRRFEQIAACRLRPKDDVYIWTAIFRDGGRVEYKVEELAHAIRRSRDLSAA
ncbi:hypothetical protein PHMEG_0003547 [Phytophthora megakarya]|uniref:Uncharacterized protein n=1 Tax=Phytophthora megakarya TaxID=4795 RepID=A0A225WXS8_9STRA|nr:hypothetical protein PHMEG_0003547 [Phytophthora megakarya]